MAESYQIFKTPNPDEYGLRIDVPIISFTPRDVPKIGTALQDCSDRLKSRKPDDFMTYVMCEVVEAGPGMFSFKFCPPKTRAQALTPFHVYTTNTEYAWPTVLKEISFVKDSLFPLSTQVGSNTVYADTIYARKILRPGATFESLTIVREYLSDFNPFLESDLFHQEPVPTTVVWEFNGSSDSIKCLHPLIVIKARGRKYTIVNSGAGSTVGAPVSDDFIFPATNFEDWAPFILSRKQVEVNGQWHMTELEIFPSSTQDIITQ